MNCIPLFYLLITPWQYSFKITFWLSRTLCAKSNSKKNHIPLAAGRPSATQNHTKQMIPFPSISLPDSVILCCIFQHQPWTKLFSKLMLLLRIYTKHLFMISEDICIETWFSLCLHLIHHEPCHLCFSFSMTQIPIIHTYSWVILFSFVELWVGVEHL